LLLGKYLHSAPDPVRHGAPSSGLPEQDSVFPPLHYAGTLFGEAQRRDSRAGGAPAGGRCVHVAGRGVADGDARLAAAAGRLFTAQMQLRRLET
jgi:hypothetical protein